MINYEVLASNMMDLNHRVTVEFIDGTKVLSVRQLFDYRQLFKDLNIFVDIEDHLLNFNPRNLLTSIQQIALMNYLWNDKYYFNNLGKDLPFILKKMISYGRINDLLLDEGYRNAITPMVEHKCQKLFSLTEGMLEEEVDTMISFYKKQLEQHYRNISPQRETIFVHEGSNKQGWDGYNWLKCCIYTAAHLVSPQKMYDYGAAHDRADLMNAALHVKNGRLLSLIPDPKEVKISLKKSSRSEYGYLDTQSRQLSRTILQWA